MPREIEIDGVKTQVYTQAEIDSGFVAKDAAEQEKNKVAAAARRDAEAENKKLLEQIESGHATKTELEAAMKTIAENTETIKKLDKEKAGIIALTAQGYSSGQAAFLLSHPDIQKLDLANAEQAKRAMEIIGTIIPKPDDSKPAPAPKPANGGGGSPSGGKNQPVDLHSALAAKFNVVKP